VSGVDTAIVERRAVELRLEVGRPPPTFAPVFQVVDSRRVALLTLGASGEDLLVGGKNPATVLRLAQPDVRWREALSGFSAGDTVSVVIDRGRGSTCMSVAGHTACGLAPSLGNGWGHVAVLGDRPAWLTGLVTLGWCMGLGLALGATAVNARASALRGGALAAVGLIGCVASPDVRPDGIHAATLAAGAVLGGLSRPWIARLWSSVRIG
jgi:hypothetical protein